MYIYIYTIYIFTIQVLFSLRDAVCMPKQQQQQLGQKAPTQCQRKVLAKVRAASSVHTACIYIYVAHT